MAMYVIRISLLLPILVIVVTETVALQTPLPHEESNMDMNSETTPFPTTTPTMATDINEVTVTVTPENNPQIPPENLPSIIRRTQEAISGVNRMQSSNGFIEQTVRTNFLSSLYLMANASAVTGASVARAAGTIIRGFVQDSFNLASIGFYLPRLIFLDGPTQFIEILRLVRTNQLRIPQDVDEAMDTVLNFATVVRQSQITGNLATPFLSFFPNVFRGVELLSTEVIYGVFSWLGPLAPTDVSAGAVEGLWNRWDIKMSTTPKYETHKGLIASFLKRT